MSEPLTRRRRRVIAVFALVVFAIVPAALWTLQVWRTESLPGLRLKDSTPELIARYGLELPRNMDCGPIVVSQSSESAALGIGDIREGDWFWIAGEPELGDLTIARLKGRLLEAHGSPLVVYVSHRHKISQEHLSLTRWQRFLYCWGVGATAREQS